MTSAEATLAVAQLTLAGYVAAACYYNNVVHVSDPIHGYSDDGMGSKYGVTGYMTVLLDTPMAIQRFIDIRQ